MSYLPSSFIDDAAPQRRQHHVQSDRRQEENARYACEAEAARYSRRPRCR